MDGERRERPQGRRALDPPGVPLREHLEALITSAHQRLEDKLAGLSDKVVQLERTAHKLKGEVTALTILEQKRVGERETTKRFASWVQWVPSVVAAFAAVYAVFFA